MLEGHGVRVVNSLDAAFKTGNKLLTTMLLAKENVPTPKTKLAFTEDTALKALNELGYPADLKAHDWQLGAARGAAK